MRLKNKPWSKEFIKNNESIFVDDLSLLVSLIKKYKRVCLEVGCGKGKFIRTLAKENPDTLYLALEKYESVIVMAAKPLVNENLENLKFLNFDVIKLVEVEELTSMFDIIYLNFSDPWPKKRHYKRRLTYKTYLDLYDKLLKIDGVIIQKTDNKNLFGFSVESFSQNDWYLSNISVDLHNEDKKNIMTEFEEKFSKKGLTINYLEARRYKNE